MCRRSSKKTIQSVPELRHVGVDIEDSAEVEIRTRAKRLVASAIRRALSLFGTTASHFAFSVPHTRQICSMTAKTRSEPLFNFGMGHIAIMPSRLASRFPAPKLTNHACLRLDHLTNLSPSHYRLRSCWLDLLNVRMTASNCVASACPGSKYTGRKTKPAAKICCTVSRLLRRSHTCRSSVTPHPA